MRSINGSDKCVGTLDHSINKLTNYPMLKSFFTSCLQTYKIEFIIVQ